MSYFQGLLLQLLLFIKAFTNPYQQYLFIDNIAMLVDILVTINGTITEESGIL